MHPLYNNYVFINVTLCRKKRKSKLLRVTIVMMRLLFRKQLFKHKYHNHNEN